MLSLGLQGARRLATGISHACGAYWPMRSSHLQRAVQFALGSSVLGFCASSAHAAEPSAALERRPPASDVPFEWSAPESCPDRAAVLESLGQLLDADATSWDRFELVRGRISRGEAAFELELEFILGRRVERRTFATRDCADLSHAAAVALALVLDPAWDWAAEPTPAPDLPKPADLSSETDMGPVAIASEPRSTAGIELQLGAEGVIDTATLGPSAFGLGLSARARMPLWGTRFGVESFGVWLPEQSIDVRPRESVEVGLTAAGVRACNWPSLALGVCAELEAGWLSASGVGDNRGREVFDTWFAPGASLVLESRLFDALLLDSRVSLLAPLTRPQYFVNQTEGVHEIPAVAVRVALGVALAAN